MPTPATFFLPELVDNSSYPTCKPPKRLKHQIYDDSSVFEAFDNHAIKVAKNNYPTFRDLLWDLVFSMKLSELEKARVIFRWITTCDLNALNFQIVIKGSPEEKIIALKNFKTSYASVFELICSYSGLHCLTINGHVKGVDYHPGDPFNGRPFNHCWNVVFIDDSWQLIDSQWATRFVSGKKCYQDVIVYQYDDFYFLMEPQQAVFSHFPHDPIWQLLKEPLTMNQFECLPYIKSQFFKCGMDFNNQSHGVVFAKEGYLKMALSFSKPDSFTYKLVTDTNSDVFQGVPLKYFVIQETASDRINFYFRFPAAGVYYMTVFVKEIKEQEQPTNHEHIMRAACEYKIVADKAAKVPLPFPMSCHDCNWGVQSSLMSYYNLVSAQENGVMTIVSKDSKPFVRTEIKFNKLRDDVEILCKLRKNGLKDEDILDQFVEVIEQSDQTIFVLNLPEPDEYALEIFANEPDEEDTFTHIGQYLLDFECPPGYIPKTSVFGPLTSDSLVLRRDGPSNIREMYDYEMNADPIGILPKLYVDANYVPDEISIAPSNVYEQQKQYSHIDTNGESDSEMPDFLPPPPPLVPGHDAQEVNQNIKPGVAYSVNGGKLSRSIDKFQKLPFTDNLINRSYDDKIHPVTGLKSQSSWSDQKMIDGDKISQRNRNRDENHSSMASEQLQKPDVITGSLKFNDGVIMREAVTKEQSPSDERRWSDDKTWISDSESIQPSDKLQPYLATVERGLSPCLSRRLQGSPLQTKNSEPKFLFGKFDVNLKGDSKFSSLSESDLNQKRSSYERNNDDSLTSAQKKSSSNEDFQMLMGNTGFKKSNFTTEPNTFVKANFQVNQFGDVNKSTTSPKNATEPSKKPAVMRKPVLSSLNKSVNKTEAIESDPSLQQNTVLKTETPVTPGVASLKGVFEGRIGNSINSTAGKYSSPGSWKDSLTKGAHQGTMSDSEEWLGSTSGQRRANDGKSLPLYTSLYPGDSRSKGGVVYGLTSGKVSEDPTINQSLTNSGYPGQTFSKYIDNRVNMGFNEESSKNRDPRYIPSNFEEEDSQRFPKGVEHREDWSNKSDLAFMIGSKKDRNQPNIDFSSDNEGLQRNYERGDRWSNKNDPGYISDSVRGQPQLESIGRPGHWLNNPDLGIFHDGDRKSSDDSRERKENWRNLISPSGFQVSYRNNPNRDRERHRSSDHLEELYLSGPGFTTNFSDDKVLRQSAERLEEWSNKSDPKYLSGSVGKYRDVVDSADIELRGSTEQRGNWTNRSDQEYLSGSIRNSCRFDNSVRNTPAQHQRGVENKEQWSHRSDQGLLREKSSGSTASSSDDKVLRRSTERLEEWSNKSDPKYLSGSLKDNYLDVVDSSFGDKGLRRSTERLEEWSNKSDPKYLSGSLKDNYLDVVDSSFGDKGLRGSSEQRGKWKNQSDQGYLSGSIRMQDSSHLDNTPGNTQQLRQRGNESRDEWSNSIDQSSLRGNTQFKDGRYAVSGEFCQPSGYEVRREDSNQSSSYGGDYQREQSTLPGTLSRLTPSSLKKPSYIEMTSDQYNSQYEDSSRIMPSPMARYRPDESTANWTSGPVQKEPPKNFQPTLIDIEKEVYKPEMQALPSGEPIANVAMPDETSKIFERLDDHAIQISTEHQDSFNQLIWQLIYARNITDELEKVRVIFLWLCTKDLHKMNFDDIKNDSPEDILMGLKSGKNTYAQIFLTLCRYAGLHCKLIIGYAKGADYVPGMKFEGRHGEHSWNSVLLSGVWRLVDCHWAARRLIGKERKPENVRYELDMFYFLANPSQLIYTHFPHEQDWQLLHHPINIEEFESLAPVKSMFFKYNLDLVTHRNAVINCYAPEFELKIAFPKGVEERLLFTFTLTLDDGSEEYNGLPLIRYGRHEIDYLNYYSTFSIRAPSPGSFKLLIYAKLISTSPVAQDSGAHMLFGAICEYKLQFEYPGRQTLPPFPSCQTPTFGPTEVYKNYPIESRTPKSSINTDNGIVEIKFLILKPEIRLMAKLISNAGESTSDKLSEQCIIQRLVAHEEMIISVYLPDRGEYGLEIYANNAVKDGNSFFAVWQYFLVASKPSAVTGLPSLPPGYIGPFEPKFTSYGLGVTSHRDPFVVVSSSDDLCIEMTTTAGRSVRIMSQLIHCTGNVSQTLANNVLQQVQENRVQFLVRLPHSGFYKLQIYALPYSESSDNLPGVFNYLILSQCSHQSNKGPFPQQFAQWKEGCYLYEPMNGVLGGDVRLVDFVQFRMSVPEATAVAVVVQGEWTRLERDGGGVWSGRVSMRLPWRQTELDPVSVCANYGNKADDSFVTILKYTIQ